MYEMCKGRKMCDYWFRFTDKIDFAVKEETCKVYYTIVQGNHDLDLCLFIAFTFLPCDGVTPTPLIKWKK